MSNDSRGIPAGFYPPSTEEPPAPPPPAETPYGIPYPPSLVEKLAAKVEELEGRINQHFKWLHGASGALFAERENMEAEIEQLRGWQRTSEGANCSGLEQLNRIVAGLVRQYGVNGELTLANIIANGVPLGQQITWSCTCGADDFIVIRETNQLPPLSGGSIDAQEETGRAARPGRRGPGQRRNQ